MTGTEHFEPLNLFRVALWTSGPAIGLAFVGSTVAWVLRLRGRMGDSSFWCSVNTLVLWPVFLWGVFASVSTIQMFDLITGHIDQQLFWVAIIGGALGLGLVLMTSFLGFLALPTNRPNQDRVPLLGVLFAVAAVALDGVFFVTVITPFR